MITKFLWAFVVLIFPCSSWASDLRDEDANGVLYELNLPSTSKGVDGFFKEPKSYRLFKKKEGELNPFLERFFFHQSSRRLTAIPVPTGQKGEVIYKPTLPQVQQMSKYIAQKTDYFYMAEIFKSASLIQQKYYASSVKIESQDFARALQDTCAEYWVHLYILRISLKDFFPQVESIGAFLCQEILLKEKRKDYTVDTENALAFLEWIKDKKDATLYVKEAYFKNKDLRVCLVQGAKTEDALMMDKGFEVLFLKEDTLADCDDLFFAMDD